MAKAASAKMDKTGKAIVNDPVESLIHPKRIVTPIALKFARKLMKPTSVASDWEVTDLDARWKKAPKLIEANQAARRARMSTSPGTGIQ